MAREKTVLLMFKRSNGFKCYHDHHNGCQADWIDGTKRSVSESKAKYLLETFPDYFFEVTGTGKVAAPSIETKVVVPPTANKAETPVVEPAATSKVEEEPKKESSGFRPFRSGGEKGNK